LQHILAMKHLIFMHILALFIPSLCILLVIYGVELKYFVRVFKCKCGIRKAYIQVSFH